jgi:putative spermidine/putrescine transport system ATP-binding protein
VRLRGLRKAYGDVVAVGRRRPRDREGEFFTLLGPSGSGKTTTLRLIAGFERPTRAGRARRARRLARPPYARDVNTVFQDYALFPHMTVRENVGYGLRVKGVAQRERAARGEALGEVRLPGSASASRPALGGQRQRVALARALVNRPRCCCSTSRSARSTSSCARRCSSSSRASSRTSASRSST